VAIGVSPADGSATLLGENLEQVFEIESAAIAAGSAIAKVPPPATPVRRRRETGTKSEPEKAKGTGRISIVPCRPDLGRCIIYCDWS
jgi:hypothetical protein